MTDWTTRCACNPEAKQRFHPAARLRLRNLAKYLGFGHRVICLWPHSLQAYSTRT
jgi:hypothetical protein